MRFKPIKLFLILILTSGSCLHAQTLAATQPPQGATRGGQRDVSKANAVGDFTEPESGAVVGDSYVNRYFALTYPLPPNSTEAVKGPPPSDAGYYVLDSFKLMQPSAGKSKGTILVAAWDLFFVPQPAKNALELVKDIKGRLPRVYEVEAAPAEVKIAGRSFVRFDYGSSTAQLHWKVLATEVRCHMVEFVLTGRDTAMLEDLVRSMDRLRLPEGADVTSGTGGGAFPVCVKDYATGSNVLHKVDPVMAEPRFSNVPVRVVIGVDGKVSHVHVISGSSEQAKSVKDALAQWSFKPYMQNGVPMEVETGMLFKFPPDGVKLPPAPEKY